MKNEKTIIEPLFLSNEKIDEINRELEQIETTILPEIQKRMAVAYEDGDLPENNPWIAANTDLQVTLKQRNDLRRLLNRAKQFQKSDKTRGNRIGKFFRISINNQQEREVQLVSSIEGDPETGKISDESPIGKAILTAKFGVTFLVNTPNGSISLIVKPK